MTFRIYMARAGRPLPACGTPQLTAYSRVEVLHVATRHMKGNKWLQSHKPYGVWTKCPIPIGFYSIAHRKMHKVRAPSMGAAEAQHLLFRAGRCHCLQRL